MTQTYQLLHGLPNGRQYFGNNPLPHTPTTSKSTGKKESVEELKANQEKPLSEPRISSLLVYTVLTLNSADTRTSCKSGSVNKASPTLMLGRILKEKKGKIEETSLKHKTVTTAHSCITFKLLLIITNSQNCPFKVVGVTELKLGHVDANKQRSRRMSGLL